LSQRYAQSYGISQTSLFESAYVYLKEVLHWPEDSAKELILKDYVLTGKTDLPKFFKTIVKTDVPTTERSAIPKRQQRHLAGKQEVLN
jgi:hypothetical protein